MNKTYRILIKRIEELEKVNKTLGESCDRLGKHLNDALDREDSYRETIENGRKTIETLSKALNAHADRASGRK